MTHPDEQLRLDLQWIVSKLDNPDKAARHTYRGIAAIQHVAKQALERTLARESHGAVGEAKPKGHGLMCVIFATDLYAAMAKDGYTLPTNGSFGPATSEFIRAHISDYMAATPAAPPKEGWTHKWDRAGERCLLCGDKDWMGGKCSGPRPNATTPPKDAGAVAWLATNPKSGEGFLTQFPSKVTEYAARGYTITPLYTHPQPEGCVVDEAMVEAARNCADGKKSCSEDWGQEDWRQVIAAALAAASSGAGEGAK